MNFRGVDVLTAPPNTQGFVLLHILKALAAEGLNGEALGPDGATLARLLAFAALRKIRPATDGRTIRKRAYSTRGLSVDFVRETFTTEPERKKGPPPVRAAGQV